MQLEEDPSISQVANRFMGTGLLSAPLPGKLRRPLLSAMVRAAGGTVRYRAAGVGGGQLRHADVRRRYFPDCPLCFSAPCARKLTVAVPCERWRTSSFLPVLRSASRAEELQWGAARERARGLLCTTTLLRRYEERLVPHAQARRGAGRRRKEVRGGLVGPGERRSRHTAHFFFFFFAVTYGFDLI